MSNSEDRTPKFDLHIQRQLIASFHIYIQSKMMDSEHQQLLKSYFALSVKDTLSDVESETMEYILDRACQNTELMTLVQVVDQQINEQLYTSHPEYLDDIETTRVNALKKVLGSAVRSKSVPAPMKPKLGAIAKLQTLLVPLSLMLVGFLFTFFYDEALSIAKNLRNSSSLGMVGKTPHSIKSKHHIHKKSTPAHPIISGSCQRESISWVHQDFEGERTAYGETFDNSAYTAAHEFLPPGSKIHLQSEKTSHSVVVEVNDWNDTLLVSYSAAAKLGVIDKGVAPVVVERVEVNNIDMEEYLNNTQLAQLANFQRSCGFLLTSNHQP
ncbi:MAG: septal ring lytic transglycosylase RlpA family protein [Cyanobacteria bacterium P01_H01_bin.21]